MTSQNSPLKFAAWFIVLFLVFYYFNIAFWGVVSPGGYYSPFLAGYLNYIVVLRSVLLHSTEFILKTMGFGTIINDHELLLAGHGIINVSYSCLGLGVLSFFVAFVIAYPKPFKAKMIFLLCGILTIEILNVLRFVILALFLNKDQGQHFDHHTIFNILIYIIISISLFFWVKNDIAVNK
jgi:exosortase/archaeosortase family protein